MSSSFSSAAERNKNAQLTSGYDAIAQSLFGNELSVVGNYELGPVIGKGTFGKVYLAHHIMTRSKVVIKAADKFGTEGLAREIYHHRRLRHPHITKLYEVIHTEKHVWLVLEYCAGGELYEFLLNRKRLKESIVQRMFAQLVGAVIYIHKSGCVHRDLKLENILLDRSENIKLGDFGFTREYDPRKLLETWCGTYAYAAPEMIQGEKYSGEGIDVWSMGVIMYALLCGELPFDEEDEAKLKEKIVKREYDLPEYLSSDAKGLITSMLARSDQRLSLEKILMHPFLSQHASKQLHILAHNLIIPFAAPIEKRLLDRFEKSNIDTRTLIQQMSEGGYGPLVGFWELSLERAKKIEELKKKRKKRRRSQDIEVLEITTARSSMELNDTQSEATPLRNRFGGHPFPSPKVTSYPEERPQSRASRASKGSRNSRRERPPSRSRSRSPQKSYSYRGPVSPVKAKERSSRGFLQVLRSIVSGWSNHSGKKLTHKKSKGGITSDSASNKENRNPLYKNPLELKKSGESSPKEEKRNRKPHLPNISIHPPPNPEEPPSDFDSPARGVDDDSESAAGGSQRRSRRNRPSYRRRSTSSSINSMHSLHRYSHSKTSSTSSAGSGSVSTPRHSHRGNLKVVPATPPPHMLTHEGAKGLSPIWGDGVVIARRRRSPFRGPPVGFMSHVALKRKNQSKQNGKWPEGAIKEEDEEAPDEVAVEDVENEEDVEVDEVGRGSYDVSELDAVRRGDENDMDDDGRSISASV